MKRIITIILILVAGILIGWFLKEMNTSKEIIQYQDRLYRQVDALIEDSIKLAISTKTQMEDTIAIPYDLQKLHLTENIDFTSGGISKEYQNKYCDNAKDGFYGRYHLIDKSSRLLPAFKGEIDIFKTGKMGSWRSDDLNQKIWRIHLKSNLISVWDSITIGLTRKKIESFGKINNGFCVKKGDAFYYCDFNNFLAVFIFQSDTLKELTVTRKCKKE